LVSLATGTVIVEGHPATLLTLVKQLTLIHHDWVLSNLAVVGDMLEAGL
jgi:hypothetical protein